MKRLNLGWNLSKVLKLVVVIALLSCSITVLPVKAEEAAQVSVLRTDYSVSGNNLIWFEMDANGVKQIHYRNLKTGDEKLITDSPTAKDAPYIGGNMIVWADKGNQTPESTYWDIYSYDLVTGKTLKLNVRDAQYAYPSTDGEVVTWYDTKNYGEMFFYIFNYPDWPTFTDQTLREGKYPIVANNKVVYMHGRDGGLSLRSLSTNVHQYLATFGGNNFVDWFAFNGTYVLFKQVNSTGESKYVSIDVSKLSIEPKDVTEFSKKSVEYSFMAVGDTQGAFIVSEGEEAIIKGVDLATSNTYTVELPSKTGKMIGFSGDLLLYEGTDGTVAAKDLSNGGQGTIPDDGGTVTPGDGSTVTPGDGSGTTPGDGGTVTPGDGSGTTPGDGSTVTPGDGSGTTPGDGSTVTPGDGSGTTPGAGNTEAPGGVTTVVTSVVTAVVPKTVEDVSSRTLGTAGGKIAYGAEKEEARLDVGQGTFTGDSQISLKPQALTDLKLVDAKGRKLETSSAWLVSSGQAFAQGVPLTVGIDMWSEWKDSAEKLGVYEYNVALGIWTYVGGITQNNQGVITATIQKPGIYAVMLRDVQFQDVSEHWSTKAVEVLASRGIIDGIEDGLFAPSSTLTRGQFTKLLVEALQLKADPAKAKSYADVSIDAWYAEAVKAASSAGIVEGTAGSFKPEESITREQMITMLIRAIEISGHTLGSEATDPLSGFKDTESISSWAKSYVGKAVDLKLIEGSGESLNPQGTTTRAEGAMVLYRMMESLGLL